MCVGVIGKRRVSVAGIRIGNVESSSVGERCGVEMGKNLSGDVLC